LLFRNLYKAETCYICQFRELNLDTFKLRHTNCKSWEIDGIFGQMAQNTGRNRRRSGKMPVESLTEKFKPVDIPVIHETEPVVIPEIKLLPYMCEKNQRRKIHQHVAREFYYNFINESFTQILSCPNLKNWTPENQAVSADTQEHVSADLIKDVSDDSIEHVSDNFIENVSVIDISSAGEMHSTANFSQDDIPLNEIALEG
jgi:hypothetical protein